MNKATQIIAATFGVVLAIAGMTHGIFEILQGNVPTNGLIIQAIGDEHQMWFYGTEEAFSILPNFLFSGILTLLTSAAVMVWSIKYIGTRHGASVFILLFVMLFLVGGGIAQVVFFLPTWGAATRINKPLPWWKKILPESLRNVLAKLWPVTLAVATVCFLVGLYIAVFGIVPGMDLSDPERILSICWAFIFGGGLAMLLVSFVSGFAADIQKIDRE